MLRYGMQPLHQETQLVLLDSIEGVRAIGKFCCAFGRWFHYVPRSRGFSNQVMIHLPNTGISGCTAFSIWDVDRELVKVKLVISQELTEIFSRAFCQKNDFSHKRPKIQGVIYPFLMSAGLLWKEFLNSLLWVSQLSRNRKSGNLNW